MGMGKDCITDNELYIFLLFHRTFFDACQADLEAVLAFQENCDPEHVPRLPFSCVVPQTLEKAHMCSEPINGAGLWYISSILYHVPYQKGGKKARSKGLEPSTLASQNFVLEV